MLLTAHLQLSTFLGVFSVKSFQSIGQVAELADLVEGAVGAELLQELAAPQDVILLLDVLQLLFLLQDVLLEGGDLLCVLDLEGLYVLGMQSLQQLLLLKNPLVLLPGCLPDLILEPTDHLLPLLNGSRALSQEAGLLCRPFLSFLLPVRFQVPPQSDENLGLIEL